MTIFALAFTSLIAAVLAQGSAALLENAFHALEGGQNLWIKNQDCQYSLNAIGTLKLPNDSVLEMACALLI